MGVEFVLLNTDTKQAFMLGKGNWFSLTAEGPCDPDGMFILPVLLHVRETGKSKSLGKILFNTVFPNMEEEGKSLYTANLARAVTKFCGDGVCTIVHQEQYCEHPEYQFYPVLYSRYTDDGPELTEKQTKKRILQWIRHEKTTHLMQTGRHHVKDCPCKYCWWESHIESENISLSLVLSEIRGITLLW